MLILIPNLLTALSFALGIYSMVFLHRGGDAMMACWIIFVCAILDVLDGSLARSLNATSSFGRFFDSAADFVSFGLVPVFVSGVLARDHGILFLISSGVYLSSCLFRLIRFHLLTREKTADFFLGLPITASACFFAAAVLTLNARLSMPALIFLQILLAFLMVSKMPVPRLRFRFLRNPKEVFDGES